MIAQALSGYSHLTTTGLVFTGPSVIHTININTKAALASAVSVYDGTSAAGTLIAVIDGTINASYVLDVYCAVGIYISVSASNPDLTIAFHRQEL